MSKSNGTGSLTQRKIEEQLAHHVKLAEAFRLVRDALNGDAAEKRQERAPTVLEQALALDGERAQRTRGRKPWGSQRVAKEARQQEIAATLAQFSLTTPRAVSLGKMTGGLVAAGYLTTTPDGYLRTSKPYHGQAPTNGAAPAARTSKPLGRPPKPAARLPLEAPEASEGPAYKARREASAALLAQFSTTEARPSTSRYVGAYLTGGYLKKTADGYLRTAKPFRTALTPANAKSRKQSAALLAKFSTEAATPAPAGYEVKHRGVLGALTRRGYLVKEDGGYRRTDQEFVL